MEFYFMDVVDAGVSRSGNLIILIVIAWTVLAEALLMMLFRYNAFSKSFLDAMIVNLASVGVGYALLKMLSPLFDGYGIGNLGVLLGITIAVESFILYFLNREKRFVQTLKVCAVMNIVTYLLFYLYIVIARK